ncbi:MAG: MBL fold metallo-hydrolase [Cetobacterium sp.]|uniref:MBL fold metallo-hydrolase n=1 Tax=Cetobacterium sp. TaxID=2071632 RepID=UPI002FCBA9E0
MEKFELYYIYHSCFALETKNYFLIFDYFKMPLKEKNDDISLEDKILQTDKKVIIFSSHNHHDHFNKDIFNWKNLNSSITYILSSDITIENKQGNYFRLNKGETLELDGISLTTYDSTDIGVSFLIKVDGIKVFHAGDLNWWYWKDDTKEEERAMREHFQGIVGKVSEHQDIDLALFPIDPRLEEFCFLGGEYFANKVHPKIMVPMHFDDNFFITEEFKERIVKFKVKGISIKKTNSSLL